jgi:ankyrin repeat protein
LVRLPVSQTLSTSLHLSAYEGNFDIFHTLIEAGAELLSKNKYNDTFLHIAVRHGR